MMDRRTVITAAAAARLAEFQRLLAKLDNREMSELEAFMRGLGAPERMAGEGIS